MTTIELQIDRNAVYNEVAKTTGYTGQKMVDDSGAYDRILTTDADQEMLARFWDECRAEITQRLVGVVSSEGMTEETIYTLVLNVSSAFDKALQPSMTLSLFSYFVQSLTAKWFLFTNKGEADKSELRAKASLEDVREKAYYKKKPMRPTY